MIELKSVTKKYGKHTVVRDAECVYEDGKIYGLIGYNGSGKTTLLKTIAGVFSEFTGPTGERFWQTAFPPLRMKSS